MSPSNVTTSTLEGDDIVSRKLVNLCDALSALQSYARPKNCPCGTVMIMRGRDDDAIQQMIFTQIKYTMNNVVIDTLIACFAPPLVGAGDGAGGGDGAGSILDPD